MGVSNWLLWSPVKWKLEKGLEYRASEMFYNLWYVEIKKGKNSRKSTEYLILTKFREY